MWIVPGHGMFRLLDNLQKFFGSFFQKRTAFLLVFRKAWMPAFAGMTMGVLKDGGLISPFWIATPLRGSQ
jgi:hypothetical protein